MIISFVIDRPASLEILKGFFLDNLDKQFGILTHAFVYNKFRYLFANFPYYTELKYYNTSLSEEEANYLIKENIIKIVDSGIFVKKRNIDYEDLFQIYEATHADFGVIIDHINDRANTLLSAYKAMETYNRKKRHFNLIGVAQGRNLEEYFHCTEQLVKMDFEYIGIGGLLQRNGDSNYLRVSKSKEKLLKDLIQEINSNFPWIKIFVFGAYNPRRHSFLHNLQVWGADYKGWLFNYEEDYSFIKEYINKFSIPDKERIINKLTKYQELRKKYKLIYTRKRQEEKESRTIKELKRELEKEMIQYNLSFQLFRFLRIRDNLNKLCQDNKRQVLLQTPLNRWGNK
jgi:hypothetical protein